MSGRYAIGIDLGTTHCAVARVALEGEGAHPEVVPLEQLVARGSIEARPLLPSFLYLPHESEGTQPLPWDHDRAYAVGEYARSRGVEAPARLVSSAKSWLCHPGIDRRAGVLPLNAPEDIEAISPVEASWRYLEHLAEAYGAHVGAGAPRLTDEDVVLTVPASFDAAARELTVEAATAAGIDKLTLLEEPQAALYAWIDAVGADWRRDLAVGDVILVVDVGGGTSDFSAIAVAEEEGSLALRRVAVGEHILLGGDNMDLALAHLVEQKLVAQGSEIDRLQRVSLTHACRIAKERLLSDAALESAPVVLAARGSALLGASLRSELTRGEITRTLVDGFFPICAASDRPATRARAALTRVGLPYAQDAGVTRHLAAFLGKQAHATSPKQDKTGTVADRAPKLLWPTAVLFNGGVMKAAPLRNRLLDTLNDWLTADGAPRARELASADLDLAVARGAAYYALARRGKGLRIRGGTARAYYVGVESAVPAVPGIEPPITALCVAPFGMEEGTSAELPPHEFGVVVGEPVRFRFFGSTTRRDDRAGTELERWKSGELEELPQIEITLPSKGRVEGDVVPVRLEARVTPVGTLLLEAIPTTPLAGAASSTPADERWRVELNVRGA